MRQLTRFLVGLSVLAMFAGASTPAEAGDLRLTQSGAIEPRVSEATTSICATSGLAVLGLHTPG